jgi:Fe2+ or Zn2+ uptake regulation protein
MMSYKKTLTENRRLGILQILAEDSGYEVNSAILQQALESIGVGGTLDQVRSECAWLEEQGLVTTRETGSFVVVTLTQRGEDVARNRIAVPGVKRPRPGM